MENLFAFDTQVLLSYGILFGAGACAVRETSNLMIGQYFKVAIYSTQEKFLQI